jgi:predicted ester cyclase
MDASQVVDRFFEEVWNQRKYAVLDEIVDPDCVTHQLRSADGPIVGVPRGPAALRQHIEEWVAAFPDIVVSVDQRCRGAAHIVSWVTMRGRNDGPWQGVPPTKRHITIRTVAQHRVETDRIREDWVMVDALGLLQQLGIVGSTAELLAAAKTSSKAR